MNWILRILLILVMFLVMDLFHLVVGFSLSHARNAKLRKLGNRLWAMSNMFTKKLPDHCDQTCDGRCRNWTCPRYHK